MWSMVSLNLTIFRVDLTAAMGDPPVNWVAELLNHGAGDAVDRWCRRSAGRRASPGCD